MALLVACLSVSIPAYATPADEWTEDGGVQQAGQIVVACLAGVPQLAALDERQRCVRRPFEDCVENHGDNTRELGDCVSFARKAWIKRLEAQGNRLRVVAGPLAKAFDDTQARWRAWSEQDCVLQAAPSEGGTIHSYLLAECALVHTGSRALELEALADEWTEHPPVSRPTVR